MTNEQKTQQLRARGVQIDQFPSGALRLTNRANTILVQTLNDIRVDDIETFGRVRTSTLRKTEAQA